MMFREAHRLAQAERDEELLRRVFEAEDEIDARMAYNAALRGVTLPRPQIGGGR